MIINLEQFRSQAAGHTAKASWKRHYKKLYVKARGPTILQYSVAAPRASQIRGPGGPSATLFRGDLPIRKGWMRAEFFNSPNIGFRGLKTFLVEQPERDKQHGVSLAEKEGQPFQYLPEKTGRQGQSAVTISTRPTFRRQFAGPPVEPES